MAPTGGETPASRDTTGAAALDLGRHFRDLREVFLPALAIALVCAVIVFGVRSAAPKQWAATVVARADTTTTSVASSSDSTAATLLTAPYIALGTDARVLHDIVAAARVPWTDAQAASRIAVSAGQTPGLVTVTVTGDAAEQASVVASQAVTTLDSAARARAREATAAATAQLQADASDLNDQVQSLAVLDPKRAALQTQYQAALDQVGQVRSSGTSRLAPLADPVTSAGPVSPQPAKDAALALLLALIVAAEIMVAARGRWGHKVSRPWARRVARTYGAEFIDCSGKAAGPGRLSAETTTLNHLRAGKTVMVLNSSAEDDAVRDFVTAVRMSASGAGRLIQLPADGAWWRSPEFAPGACGVIIAPRNSAERPLIAQQLRVLVQAKMSAVLILMDAALAAPEEHTTEDAITDEVVTPETTTDDATTENAAVEPSDQKDEAASDEQASAASAEVDRVDESDAAPASNAKAAKNGQSGRARWQTVR